MAGKCPEDIMTINAVMGMMFRSHRERSGVSPETVAESLFIHVDEVHACETGEIQLPPAKLYIAGKLFGVKISAFFEPYYYPDKYSNILM